MKYRQTRPTGRASKTLVAALLALTIAASPTAADETEMRRIVASGSLAQSPNSLLLDYLLNDGKDALPPDLHKQAVDQIIEALRTQTLVDPLEGMSEIMAAANPMNMFKGNKKGLMKSMGMGMLRSATGGGGGGMSSGMQSQMDQMQKEMDKAMIDPWVRGLGAASTLTQAGYSDDASRFYMGCLTSIGSIVPSGSKNDWLQDQCINGALLMGPNDAGALFAGLWEEPYMDYGFDFATYGGQDAQMPAVPEIQAVAAHGLGKLVGSGQLTAQQRAGVMQALIDMVQMKKPDFTALTGGVQGLSFAEDQQAIQPLQKMWKKGKPKEIRPVALGGLVASYREPDAIKAMRKELKTGTGIVTSYKKAKSFAPWTGDSGQQQPKKEKEGADDAEARYLAARSLIHAEDDAGYEFAAKFLDKRNVPPGDWDYRPDLIRDLVETGGDRSKSVLHEMVTDGHQNEWLEAMMRTGLLELGDLSQIPDLRALVDKKDWDFGRGTAARWYKRFKPLLWQAVTIAAKTYMGMPPDQQDWQRIRQIVTNMAWGERDRILGRKSERDVKTDQFRWQLADSAGAVDVPGCLSILAPLLGDEEASVRLSAASALLGQSSTAAADLLFRALTLDYGTEGDISRNPEIHAALTRRLVRTFPNHPATQQALQRAAMSDSPSVQFLALTAQRDIARRSASSG